VTLKLIRCIYLFKSLWAVLAALLVGSILIAAAGSNPIKAYAVLFHGAFFEYEGFASTLVKACPLIFAGLAFALPLWTGVFNIGTEGQIYIGALFATVVALHAPEMPAWVHILLCCVAGAIGGALWALLPAILKAYYRINELIVTLLMSYVAINIVSYFVNGPMMEAGAPYPYSREIPEKLFLPFVLPGTDAHIGVLVGVCFAILLFVVFRRTTFGFSLITIGRNPDAARYAGMSVQKLTVLAFLMSGALAGLAGTFEVLGLKYRLFHLFSPGYGYDGIVVAFLAGANPLFVVVSSLFLAGLRSGANIMQRVAGVQTTVVGAVQGLVIIFVAVSLAFHFDRAYWARIFQIQQNVRVSSGEQQKGMANDRTSQHKNVC